MQLTPEEARVAAWLLRAQGSATAPERAGEEDWRPLARSALAKIAKQAESGDDGTRFVDELTVAQVKAMAESIEDGESMDPRVRIYKLADGSIDVHQSDAVDNIDPDGKRNG